MSPVIPAPDALPLPAPVWLFRTLLLVTFFLHLIAMNFLMGGGLLAALSAWRGRANVPHHRRFADQIFRILPVANAATVTLGVAPLLFLQVLYGQFFFTSSVLMAVPWISVIALLMLAYYGHYVMALSETITRERRLWIAWAASLMVVAIGFLYTNNLTLMQAPEKFHSLYVQSRMGLRLNHTEPTLLPRFLHFFVAALAVTGLGIVALGHRENRRGDPAFGLWQTRYGKNWFAGATLAQLIVGVWFLFSLPPAVRASFLGGSVAHTAHLFGAVFLALAAVFLLSAKPESARGLRVSCALVALAILGMALVRQWVRDLLIGPLAALDAAEVRTQWSVLAIFLILFLGAAGTVGWLIRRYAAAERAKNGRTAA